MGNKKRDKKAHEKFKSWLLGFLTDLAVGIILLVIARLL